LINAGIQGIVLKLLTFYLSNRIQLVKINNTYHNPLIVNHGVLQGNLGTIILHDINNDLFDLMLMPK
jgi:hypothetical protein